MWESQRWCCEYKYDRANTFRTIDDKHRWSAHYFATSLFGLSSVSTFPLGTRSSARWHTRSSPVMARSVASSCFQFVRSVGSDETVKPVSFVAELASFFVVNRSSDPSRYSHLRLLAVQLSHVGRVREH
jgi:hypothetical protein